jgi:hypothetical protein
MAKASATEQTALDEAGLLVRFAAENVTAKDLDQDLALAVARAQAADANDAWTPEISQAFWTAFTKLCTAIQPATMECIAAAHPTVPRKRWFFFGPIAGMQSLAERTSVRYLPLLIVLLVAVLSLQFYVWAISSLSKRIDDTIVSLKASEAKAEDVFAKIIALPQGATIDMSLGAASEKSVQEIATLAIGLISDAKILSALSFADYELHLEDAPNLPKDRKRTGDNHTYAVEMLPWLVPRIYPVQHNAAFATAIVSSFILPVLLGTLGACAFVLRNISEQIRTTTFSETSPIRHLTRVVLGALSGGVIGLFTNLSTQLALPLLAVAFLAGYGVEGVFSMFDGFIDRFRAASK